MGTRWLVQGSWFFELIQAKAILPQSRIPLGDTGDTIARMRRLLCILIMLFAAHCCAQNHCSLSTLSQAADRVSTLRQELGQAKVGEMDDEVPPAVADKITQLKDALSRTSDAALACARPSVDPTELQKSLAQALHANAPEPADKTVISKDDHRYDEIFGSYGHNLRVQVSRPSGVAGVIAIQYSTNIECGTDSMLLAYELHDGVWTEKLRWQSPPLKSISDAFGDFFVSAVLPGSSALENEDKKWRVVVAHGTPWCTSRYSGFKIDLLSPSSDAASPRLLWHTERGYSRGGFDPRIKSIGNTFELRLNADCMVFDPASCFERRVIYRYSVDGSDSVHRVRPIGRNARGFVEEWLSAPWSESRELSVARAVATLQTVHDQFDPPVKPNDDQFVSHGLGPVRACAVPGTFQVQINSTLEKIVPGKPGGDSTPLASRYFHVRELKDGYLMLSAPSEPDPSCTGADLTPAGST